MNIKNKILILLATILALSIGVLFIYDVASKALESKHISDLIEARHRLVNEIDEHNHAIEEKTAQIERIKQELSNIVGDSESNDTKILPEELSNIVGDSESNDTKILPEEFNPKGEKHPDLIVSVYSGTDRKVMVNKFVMNNCIPEIQEVWEQAYEYAESNEIHGGMPFLISWADSQCGKHMSTPNNPGNVNNNDRGNRVGFFTMTDGLNAITDTLNNKYMSGIEKIGHLSQGGRNEIGSKYSCAEAPAPFKCYATSEYNHFKNTMRALRAMLGESPELTGNFNFRI
jgi:hypothetical protein